MKLKKYSNGAWTTITTWSGTGKGVSGVSLSKNKSGLVKGYSYKVTVTAKVYQGDTLLETASKDSKIVKI